MEDKKLLQLAAKAAGLSIDNSDYTGGGYGNGGFDMLGNVVLDWHNNKTWNPLTDDGDALRLAVELQLQVTPGTYNKNEMVVYRAGMAEASELVSYQKDECSATRRAIVRAAASIGESIK